VVFGFVENLILERRPSGVESPLQRIHGPTYENSVLRPFAFFDYSDRLLGVGSSGGGYYTVNFPDGSALLLTFTGTTKVVAPGKFRNKATSIVIGGKGRYAGAKGEGTFEEQATQAAVPGDPVIGYIDIVINIKK
jgi:hypothetical protein